MLKVNNYLLTFDSEGELASMEPAPPLDLRAQMLVTRNRYLIAEKQALIAYEAFVAAQNAVLAEGAHE